VAVNAVILKRRQIEPESGNQLRVKPVRPVPELMKDALAAQPPRENGEFRQAELVELTSSTRPSNIEIRYQPPTTFSARFSILKLGPSCSAPPPKP